MLGGSSARRVVASGRARIMFGIAAVLNVADGSGALSQVLRTVMEDGAPPAR